MILTDNKLRKMLAKGFQGSGRYWDIRAGDGLFLRVSQARTGVDELHGATSWYLNYRAPVPVQERDPASGQMITVEKKKSKTIKVGVWPDAGIREAVDLAQQVLTAVERGVDPKSIFSEEVDEDGDIAIVAITDASTFREAALLLHKNIGDSFKNEKDRKSWRKSLQPFFDAFGRKYVGEVEPSDIATILRPMWVTKHVTATRVAQRLERIFTFARAAGAIDRNAQCPAASAVALMPAHKHKEKHHNSLPYAEAPELYTRLVARQSVSAKCLQWVMLTGCRSNEARGARWSEIDLDERVWRVPEDRVKTGGKTIEGHHTVVLTDEHIRLLEEIGRLSDKTDLVFPNSNDKQLSENVFRPLIRSLGYVEEAEDGKQVLTITAHGMRATFRGWVEECTLFETDIAETMLGHVVGNRVERAYKREAVRKAKMLQIANTWANYLTGAVTLEELEKRIAEELAA